jgi:hypothetical protein
VDHEIYAKSIKEHSLSHELMMLNKMRCGFKTPFESILAFEHFDKKQVISEDAILREATYEHDKDISYIMDKYVFPFIKSFLDDIENYLEEYKYSGRIIYDSFSSIELPSDLAKMANEKNTIAIAVGTFDGSRYIVSDKALFVSAIRKYIVEKLIEIQNTVGLETVRDQIRNAIEIENIRATISHELSHWLDESLRNKRLSTYMDKMVKKKVKPDFVQTKNLVSDIEINAYIHGLKEYKKTIGEEAYDKLTLKELFENTTLGKVWENVSKVDQHFKFKWLKKMASRMTREGLVGKNMNFQDLT